MMEWIVVTLSAMAVFGLFLVVMAFKEKRSNEKPPIHTCANQGGCRCGRQGNVAMQDAPPSRCSDKPAT